MEHDVGTHDVRDLNFERSSNDIPDVVRLGCGQAIDGGHVQLPIEQ